MTFEESVNENLFTKPLLCFWKPGISWASKKALETQKAKSSKVMSEAAILVCTMDIVVPVEAHGKVFSRRVAFLPCLQMLLRHPSEVHLILISLWISESSA